MSADDWAFLVELMRAHDAVRRASRYVALVLEKPLARSAASASRSRFAVSISRRGRAPTRGWQPLADTGRRQRGGARVARARAARAARHGRDRRRRSSRCSAVIADVPRQTEWMYDCDESRLIRADGPDVVLLYNRTSAPWPASDRDVVLR